MADQGYSFPRLRGPRFCRFSRRSHRLSGERLVGETLAYDPGSSHEEAGAVAHLAGIESKTLLVQVPKQVERLDTDVGSLDSALEQRPEVFEPVGVNLA